MKYIKIILIISLIFLTGVINGMVLDEKTLNSLNPGDIIINKNDEICKNYSFSLDKIDLKSKAFLQMSIKNHIPANEGVEIKTYLNDLEISVLKNKEISALNVIELVNLQKNNNHLEICAKNTFLPRLIISSESIIGNYYVAEINDVDFYQEVPTTAYTNTMIPINLYVKNSGWDDIYIELINATEKFMTNYNLENVSGETNYEGVLKAQETLVLNYFVKTDLNISFATPFAKLKYTDRFGVEHIKTLDTKIITLIEQENKLQAYIDLPNEVTPNKYYTGHLIIKNNSEE
ncbi:hypothetical protein EOM09_07735, partial [bacterium]|nr:hypothetical protein [bacterium]